MKNNKIHCMKIAKKYEKDYWDGDRKYGYGGFKYIPGRLSNIAKSIIKKFKLNNNLKILDLGCVRVTCFTRLKNIYQNVK